MDAVALSLPNQVYEFFSCLLPVMPQISADWGLAIALLPWAVSESVVVLDLRSIDGRLFVSSLPVTATRAHMCRAAGLDEAGDFHVYLYGQSVPLIGDAEVETRTGGSIAFVLTDRIPQHRSLLSEMLAATDGWDADPAILPRSPGGRQGPYVCLVFEDGYRLHTLNHPQGEHRRSVAQQYGFREDTTALQATLPRQQDVCLNGYHCRGVACVSGDLPQVPISPRRFNQTWFLAVVDCRPLPLGWHQLFITEGFYLHSDLTDLFEVFAPDG